MSAGNYKGIYVVCVQEHIELSEFTKQFSPFTSTVLPTAYGTREEAISAIMDEVDKTEMDLEEHGLTDYVKYFEEDVGESYQYTIEYDDGSYTSYFIKPVILITK